MQFLQFLAAVAISYLGLLAGFILATMTREELPTAKKYFPWLQRLVIILVAAVSMRLLNFGIPARLASYAALLVLLAVKPNLQLFYALFGAAVFAAARNSNALLITSSLVFLFGLLSGSSSFDARIRKKDIVKAAAKILANNLFYPAIAIVLFLAFSR